MDAWELIKNRVSSKVSAEAFQNWFGRTGLREFRDGTIWVSVSSESARQYVESEYSGLIHSAIQDLGLPIRDVVFETSAAFGAASMLGPGGFADSEVVFQKTLTQLNPGFTFESFVVGSCNQFAHAAAKAVADKPAVRYNPLYIYGGVGMGKTHLMHAIGQGLMTNYASLRIVYTSSERFMNEMITSIKLQKMSQFHQHYRSADVLLIDRVDQDRPGEPPGGVVRVVPRLESQFGAHGAGEAAPLGQDVEDLPDFLQDGVTVHLDCAP